MFFESNEDTALRKESVRAYLSLMRNEFELLMLHNERYIPGFHKEIIKRRHKIERDGFETLTRLAQGLDDLEQVKEVHKEEILINYGKLGRQNECKIIFDRIDTYYNLIFKQYLPSEIKSRFNPNFYFDRNEENTRDAGEELCAHVIHLLAKSAAEFSIGSIDFYNEFERLCRLHLSKNLMESGFIKSALNENKDKVKKNHIGILLRYIDKTSSRNRFNRAVKESLLFSDMCGRNIGDPKSKRTKKNQKTINKTISAYAGERSIRKRVEQFDYTEKFLKSRHLSNGKTAFEMKKTPAAHFAEAYLELLALEEEADEKGYSWLFFTLTCPTEYHSNPAFTKERWKGHSARDSHEYLKAKWDNLRKSFGKKIAGELKFGIMDGNGFGCRVVEPHQDGCAHWHVMLFCKKELTEQYKELFMHYFSFDRNKKGVKGGCDIKEKGISKEGEPLDMQNEASAATYLLKYMQKTALVVLENGEIKDNSNLAVDSWRHATQIRSKAGFGYKGVKTKFNECRKIANENRDLFRVINKEGYQKKSNLTKEARKKIVIRKLLKDCTQDITLTKVKNSIRAVRSNHGVASKTLVVKELIKSNHQELSLNKIKTLIKEIEKKYAKKLVKKARKAFAVRVLNQQKPNVSFNEARNFMDSVKELTDVIKLSSAKIAKTKFSKKIKVNKSKMKWGINYKEFMHAAEKLVYETVESFNRFGEKIKVKMRIGTEEIKTKLRKYEFKIVKGCILSRNNFLEVI
ncbi:replication endonuclease [Vibrio pomeroyi]|uniref:Replication endonuclease n=1 Tax=Vibrio pomeroyi TaxID=198832 RepID=A0ABV4N582_9VIBR